MTTLPAEYQISKTPSPFEDIVASAPPVNVQQYMPIAAAKPIAPEDQKEINHALHRFWPERMFPSNLTPILDTVSDPMPMAMLTGIGTGLATAVFSGLYAKMCRASGLASVGIAAAGGVLMGGLAGIQTLIAKRNHNEDVVEAISRYGPKATIREWDSDPARQQQLNRLATVNAAHNAALTNALVYSALTPSYYRSSSSTI
jgi:hypothetical protein